MALPRAPPIPRRLSDTASPSAGVSPRVSRFHPPTARVNPGVQSTPLIAGGARAAFCNRCSEPSPSYKMWSLLGKRDVQTFFRAEGADGNGGSVTGTWARCGTVTCSRPMAIACWSSARVTTCDNDLPAQPAPPPASSSQQTPGYKFRNKIL